MAAKTKKKKPSREAVSKKTVISNRAKVFMAISAIVILTFVLVYQNRLSIAGRGVVAVVNGQKITLSYLDQEYKQVPAEQKSLVSKEDFLNNTLIPTILLLQEAEREGITITEEETEYYVGQALNESMMTREDLDAQLKTQDLAYADFVELYSERMRIVKFLNRTIGAPNITEQEARDFYNENKISFMLGNQTLGYEDVKESIKYYLVGLKQQEMIREYLDGIRNKADIQIYNENIDGTAAAGYGTSAGAGSTFESTTDEVCMKDGKPIIRLFSTTTCPHCKWISKTFDAVAKEYAQQDKIIAYHWNLDTKDDSLTEEKESIIPQEEIVIFQKYGQGGGVPLFIFGCRYTRLGNAYELEDNLEAEEKEFRYIIGLLNAG